MVSFTETTRSFQEILTDDNLFFLLFIRLIDSNLEEGSHSISSDPVLSSQVKVQSESSQRLIEELFEAGMPRAEARKIVNDLCHRTHTACLEMAQQRALHNQSGAPFKKGDRIEREGHAPVYTLVYHRKKWKKPFCIKLNASHYDKLRAMFVQVHGRDVALYNAASGKPTLAAHAFHLILMVLLLRYSSLSGGQLLLDLRGGGMQGAVHGAVFDVLQAHFPQEKLFECFGSPLNAYLASFGSAFFADLDWHFGSMGSFFEDDISEGCCEANPPFSPGLMNAMAERMFCNLALSEERQTHLTFVVIVPNAGDDTEEDAHRVAAAKRFGGISLQKMIGSPYCRRHILLPAKEHGYVEGAQHLRPTRYKESLYDTSVIVLQSTLAREQELDLDRLDTEIRRAFASLHKRELEQRRKEGSNENDDQAGHGDSSD
jgi:phosphorylated CTD-interacting factor 1